MLLGVDVGGTFTDAVLALEGRLVTAKSPTTPDDQSEGVMNAIAEVLRRAERRPEEIESFSHGMTVATNALLEGRTARTALIATEGFTDLIALARQDRPELYRLCAARPAPLVPEERRFGAPERMGPDGPLLSLQQEGAEALAAKVAQEAPEAVAVVLLHSYRHRDHELTVGEALRTMMPDVHVSLSHQVVGTFREYERAATTEIDAALSPLLAGYLRRILERVAEKQVPEPAVMQSNGGLIDTDAAAGHAALTILSGPAGGAAGAAHVARTSGTPHALCFDMGGTSCDVCVIDDGVVQERSSGEVAGRPLALPMLAVHTVGAGGGSVAWRDPGGALRVGPRSAGADPGPACYGRGGAEPTVTDANLALGYLAPDAPLAGGVELDVHAARRAIGTLAEELGLDLLECAEGIRRVAGAEMVRAMRVVTVQRGIDPRRYALLAFGGAGPLHAAHIAQELGIDTILCPRASGVLSALGLVVSPQRRDVQRTVFMGGDALSRNAVSAVVSELGERARAAVKRQDAKLSVTYELRYRGQAFELPIAAGPDPKPGELRDAFEAAHEERYGYRDPQQVLELVTIRVTATTEGADAGLGEVAPEGEAPAPTRRAATFDREQIELEVLQGTIAPGTEISGPAVVELPESTALVPQGWRGEVEKTGTLVLRR